MGLINRLPDGEVRVSARAIVNHGRESEFSFSRFMFSAGIYVLIGIPPFLLFLITFYCHGSMCKCIIIELFLTRYRIGNGGGSF